MRGETHEHNARIRLQLRAKDASGMALRDGRKGRQEMKELLILLVVCSPLYADGIRHSSGPVGQHAPAAGSHSRERVVIDGHHSALPSGAASEVHGLSAAEPVDALLVSPSDEPETGGSLVGPPQTMESASPETSAWLLVLGGLLMVGLGRKVGAVEPQAYCPVCNPDRAGGPFIPILCKACAGRNAAQQSKVFDQKDTR